jgi:hypothetical protein
MAVGTSGRIVLEIDPDTKQEIYAALEREGRTLKDWFLEAARNDLLQRKQLRLAFAEERAGQRRHHEEEK